VEHEPVRGVDEQRDGDQERGACTVGTCCRGPRDDGAREQHGHERLGEEAVCDVQCGAVDDPGDGCPEEHRPRQQRVPVEELDVAVEVLVEIASDDERPADRANRVHGEAKEEEDGRA